MLLLYDSRGSIVEELAHSVAEGVASVDGAEVIDRRLDDAEPIELLQCDALILGSPNWSGMTGKLKTWMDESGDLWESGDLAGKPGAAFTGGWSASGGIEATLLQLFHLLASHGLLFVGLPWSDRMRALRVLLRRYRPRPGHGRRPRAGARSWSPRGAPDSAARGVRGAVSCLPTLLSRNRGR